MFTRFPLGFCRSHVVATAGDLGMIDCLVKTLCDVPDAVSFIKVKDVLMPRFVTFVMTTIPFRIATTVSIDRRSNSVDHAGEIAEARTLLAIELIKLNPKGRRGSFSSQIDACFSS